MVGQSRRADSGQKQWLSVKLPKNPVFAERLPTENGDRSLSMPKGCAFVEVPPLGYNQDELLPDNEVTYTRMWA